MVEGFGFPAARASCALGRLAVGENNPVVAPFSMNLLHTPGDPFCITCKCCYFLPRRVSQTIKLKYVASSIFTYTFKLTHSNELFFSYSAMFCDKPRTRILQGSPLLPPDTGLDFYRP